MGLPGDESKGKTKKRTRTPARNGTQPLALRKRSTVTRGRGNRGTALPCGRVPIRVGRKTVLAGSTRRGHHLPATTTAHRHSRDGSGLQRSERGRERRFQDRSGHGGEDEREEVADGRGVAMRDSAATLATAAGAHATGRCGVSFRRSCRIHGEVVGSGVRVAEAGDERYVASR